MRLIRLGDPKTNSTKTPKSLLHLPLPTRPPRLHDHRPSRHLPNHHPRTGPAALAVIVQSVSMGHHPQWPASALEPIRTIANAVRILSATRPEILRAQTFASNQLIRSGGNKAPYMSYDFTITMLPEIPTKVVTKALLTFPLLVARTSRAEVIGFIEPTLISEGDQLT